MAKLTEGGDRAKASEHAIFLRRELHVPAWKVIDVLPRVADRLTGRVSLIVPGDSGTSATLPVELAILPCRGTLDWQMELSFSSHDGAWDFFEGDIRFGDLVDRTTEIVLVGRFAWRDELLGRADQNVMRDIAEDNLIRIFEQLLLEIESTIASAS